MTIVGMTCLAWGYRHALAVRGTATWHFTMSMMVLATTFSLRRVYWDVVAPIVRHRWPETWAEIFAIHGGTNINILFNLVALMAIYHGLKARWLLLPDDERARWHWWSAWTHPDGIYFLRRR
ncbi:hypothetical protein [uncultured Paracoccus sp.]|uniref:hypothetical protein n=1 Tax=uncultured Paracoccus sp. TaxID=189685 RepID=UPI0026083D06|nr:hypothetical protein [uncultured Paracoccus sp.]